jgi:DNA-binding CsgD family transcriptional regulator
MAPPGLLPLPLPATQWRRLAKEFGLSPQQKRIVELILCNACDKQIAVAMKLRRPTIRTYLSRIFARLGVNDRLELVLLVLRRSHDLGKRKG